MRRVWWAIAVLIPVALAVGYACRRPATQPTAPTPIAPDPIVLPPVDRLPPMSHPPSSPSIPAVPSAVPLDAQGSAILTLVLDNLDLSQPQFAAVHAAALRFRADPAAGPTAVAALREYFRARTGFRHPVDRAGRVAARGNSATPEQLQAADDALRNKLIASPVYPPHDFGAKINWDARPVADAEWIWQLHRMTSWSHLAKAYWHTGDEKYAQAWARQLRDWAEHNLIEPKPAHAWRTIEAGIRGNAWIGHFQAFVDAEAFTPEVCLVFLAAAREHARYLDAALEKKPDGNNWRLMEAEGLAAIALCFPEFKAAAQWRTRAFTVLKTNLPRQVRADGMHFEQCFNYHQGCIDWFARTAQLAKMNGFENEFGPDYYRTIEAMCAALLKMTFPDGTLPQFGDGHSKQSCTKVLREWADFFQREDFRYAGSGRAAGRPPDEISTALLNSGFYAMRSGWDAQATCLVLKCGPDGGWHCQPDNGSFELFAGGRRLTPDSGCYIYHGDDAGRAWFRQSRVHQTLTLDDKDIRYAPTLKLWQPGEQFDALVVENASYDNLTHRRAVLYVKPDLFILIDDAIGSAAGELRVHFQLLPAKIDLDAKRLRLQTKLPDGANLLIAGLPAAGRTLVTEEGQVSYNYGKKEPRPAGAFVSAKTADQPAVRFVTVLAPFTAATAPTIQIAPVGDNVPGGNRAEYTVTVNGQTHQIGYDLTTKKAWHSVK